MAEPKTRPTKASVKAFLDAIEDPDQRRDAKAVAKMMAAASGKRAQMWGDSIVGYGKYSYEYPSGQRGEWPRLGFSPRKGNLVLYLVPGFAGAAPLLKKLGKHKTGKSCLYVKKLADVDVSVLERLVAASLEAMAEKYPE